MPSRRPRLALLVPLALAASLASILAAPSLEAQPPGGNRINMTAFRKGMTELGWVEGKTYTIESRLADGQFAAAGRSRDGVSRRASMA